jgi:hypothetical protein
MLPQSFRTLHLPTAVILAVRANQHPNDFGRWHSPRFTNRLPIRHQHQVQAVIDAKIVTSLASLIIRTAIASSDFIYFAERLNNADFEECATTSFYSELRDISSSKRPFLCTASTAKKGT